MTFYEALSQKRVPSAKMLPSGSQFGGAETTCMKGPPKARNGGRERGKLTRSKMELILNDEARVQAAGVSALFVTDGFPTTVGAGQWLASIQVKAQNLWYQTAQHRYFTVFGNPNKSILKQSHIAHVNYTFMCLGNAVVNRNALCIWVERGEAYPSGPQRRGFCSSRDIWEHLEIFVPPQLGIGCCWHLVGRGPGCCWTSDRAWDCSLATSSAQNSS